MQNYSQGNPQLNLIDCCLVVSSPTEIIAGHITSVSNWKEQMMFQISLERLRKGI